MQNDKLPIGQFCRELVEDFDQDLPPRVWAHISSTLDNDRKKRRAIIYWSAAASLALLISFSAGYYLATMRMPEKTAKSGLMAIYKDTTRAALVLKSETATTDTQKHQPQNAVRKNITPSLPLLAEKPINSSEKPTKDEMAVVVPEDTLIINRDTFTLPQESYASQNTDNMPDSMNVENPIQEEKSREDIKNDFKNIPLLPVKNQNIAEKEPDKKKEGTQDNWALAEHFSPVFYMGSAMKASLADEAATSYNAVNTQNNEIKNNNKTLLVYATGVSLKYKVHKKWRLGTGVFYSAKELSTGLQHRQLDVPLTVGYGLISKKFTWDLNSGISTNVLFLPGQKNVNYSALAGTTLGYQITQKIAVTVEPVLKYNFYYPSTYILHYYPFSVAVYTGLSYRF